MAREFSYIENSDGKRKTIGMLANNCILTILTRPFPCTQQTGPCQQFEVFEVSKAGDLRRTSVTLANVLRDFGVHARDVLSLGLQVILSTYVIIIFQILVLYIRQLYPS